MPIQYPELAKGGPAKKVPTNAVTTIFGCAGLNLIFACGLAIAACLLVGWSKVSAIDYPTPITTITDSGADLYIGLWDICIEQNDRLDVEHCSDYDLIGSYNNNKCNDYVVVTKVTIIAGAALAFIAAVLCFILASKAKTEIAKVSIVGVAMLIALLAFGCLLTAWICWIVVAEESCGGSGAFQGYSYSWILAVVACALAITGTLLLCAALAVVKKLGKYPVLYPSVDSAITYSTPGTAATPEYPTLGPELSSVPVVTSPPPSFTAYPSVDAVVGSPAPTFAGATVSRPTAPQYPNVAGF